MTCAENLILVVGIEPVILRWGENVFWLRETRYAYRILVESLGNGNFEDRQEDSS
jgi:hypothetical protein